MAAPNSKTPALPPAAAPLSGSSKVNPAAINSKIIHENFDSCRAGFCENNTLSNTPSSRSLLSKGPTSSWTSIKAMPREISDYAIDPMIKTDLKKEDIQRHSVDERLNGFERAVICLKSTEGAERIYVANSLNALVRENQDCAFRDIIPGFIEELKKLDPDFHAAAAASFVNVVKFLYANAAGRAKQLLSLVYQYIEAEDQGIAAAWTDTMLDLMDIISPAEQEKEFGPVVLAKAKSSSVNARRASCLLIKKLLHKVSPDFGLKQLIPLVGALCQDTKPGVKGTMCLQIPFLVQFIKPKENILQYMNLLAKDTDQFVKKALISTMRQLFTMPDMKPLFKEILPVMKKLVKEAYSVTNNISLLQEFSSCVCEIANVLTDAGILDADNKLWFLDAFLQLSRYGLTQKERSSGVEMPAGYLNFRAKFDLNRRKSLAESLISSGGGAAAVPAPNKAPPNKGGNIIIEQGWNCRVNAAKSFNSFLKFAKELVDFNTGLHPLLIDLIHDPVPAVRAAVAGNILSVMQLLDPNGHMLRGEFISALSDDDMAVLEAIVPSVKEILLILAKGKVINPDSMTPALVEVGGAIMFCEERLQGTVNWRTHAKLLEQLSVLPYVLPGDYIFQNFVPNLFHRLQHLRQMPCRLAAADTIVIFLRNCRRANYRDEIRKKIKESFAQGRSFQDRMLYLVMSKAIIDNFSRKYFREYFFEQTLNMADDPVANVRMKLCGMIPDMQGTLKDADDERLSKQLEEVVNKIRNSETDRDVQNAMKNAVDEMKKMADMTKKNEKKYKDGKTKDDEKDAMKLKEEEFIASLEPPASTQQAKNAPPKAPPAIPKAAVPVAKPGPPAPQTKNPPAPVEPVVPRRVSLPPPTPIPTTAKTTVVGNKQQRKGIDIGSKTIIVETPMVNQEHKEKENPILAESARINANNQRKGNAPAVQRAGPSGQQQQQRK